MKELAKEAVVKVNGEYRVLRAVLVSAIGGHKVIYFDSDGREVHSERLSKSQFRGVKQEGNRV